MWQEWALDVSGKARDGQCVQPGLVQWQHPSGRCLRPRTRRLRKCGRQEVPVEKLRGHHFRSASHKCWSPNLLSTVNELKYLRSWLFKRDAIRNLFENILEISGENIWAGCLKFDWSYELCIFFPRWKRVRSKSHETWFEAL